MGYRNLDVLDAAERAAQQINDLIDRSPPRRLLHVGQMRDSAQSIGANIGEGFGREPGPDRAHRLVIARGEAEETIPPPERELALAPDQPKEYWPIRNLLVVIVRMLNSLLNG
jgi:four helix bundle protein